MTAYLLLASSHPLLAAGGVSTDPTSAAFWLQWGPIGAFLILLMSGKFIAPRYTLDKAEARADRLEAKLDANNDLIAEKFLEAIGQSRTSNAEAAAAVKEALQFIRDLQRDRENERARRTGGHP